MRIVALGQVLFWDEGSVWIGESRSPTTEHAHHALQLSVALSGAVGIADGTPPRWHRGRALFVPSDIPHAFDATGETVATIFCAPESRLGRSLMARFGADGVGVVPPAEADRQADALAAAYRAACGDESLVAACRRVLAELAGLQSDPPLPDARILKALAALDARLADPVRLADIASAVSLSPGRFRHLFASQTGVSFRQYLLWRRLQRALEARTAGASWLEAAHAANFADSAHLTRTFRRMFGMAPSALSLARPDADIGDRSDAGHG